MKHFAFPSIEQYRNVIKEVEFHTRLVGKQKDGELIFNNDLPLPKIQFIGSVKLHGTNCSFIFDNKAKQVYCQSRERIITPENDNAGFARFMATIPRDDLLFSLKTGIYDHIKVYGEWCGGSIQKGVALNQLEKCFVIFAIQKDDQWLSIDQTKKIQLPEYRIFNIYSAPTFDIEIDFNNPESSLVFLENLTNSIEKKCPFAAMFGIEGIGEGLVWRGEYKNHLLLFKTKGEKHKNIKESKLIQLEPDKANNLMSLVTSLVTEERLIQGFQKLEEKHKIVDRKLTGEFIGWVLTDIEKENMDVVIASGFDMKSVNKDASVVIRNWFFKRV